MFVKSEAILIYEGQTVSDNGSPSRVYMEKRVRCDEMETFSNQYYSEQQREMRLSRNLVIPTHYTLDIFDCEDKRYELMYVIYDKRKYKVRNILKYNGGRSYGQRSNRTRQLMVLDIQELR